jgi:membrane protein implicated in regulation of membrane protease activity
MPSIVELVAANPFWIWLGIGVILLAVEALTGSGWLLWPAASAGVVAVISLLGLHLGAPAEIGVFGVLTVVSTYLARRYLVRAPDDARGDINDQRLRLVGKTGKAVAAFSHGKGRAFVENAEWPADLEAGGDLASGAQVVVTGVKGPRLIVKPA